MHSAVFPHTLVVKREVIAKVILENTLFIIQTSLNHIQG